MKKVVALSLGVIFLCCQSAAAQSTECPPFVGIKKTKEYLKKSRITCASSARTLEKKGFVPFVVPTVATPTPTATAVPVTDFSGTYSSGVTPLDLVDAEDTCDDLGFGNVPSVDVNFDIIHDVDTGRVVGEDNLNRRGWGSASSSAFSIVDTSDASECTNGLRTTTINFSSISAESVTIERTDSFNCRLAQTSCVRRWIGTVTR